MKKVSGMLPAYLLVGVPVYSPVHACRGTESVPP